MALLAPGAYFAMGVAARTWGENLSCTEEDVGRWLWWCVPLNVTTLMTGKQAWTPVEGGKRGQVCRLRKQMTCVFPRSFYAGRERERERERERDWFIVYFCVLVSLSLSAFLILLFTSSLLYFSFFFLLFNLVMYAVVVFPRLSLFVSLIS